MNKQQLDPSLEVFFDDIDKFDQIFKIYLKLQTSRQYEYSTAPGKLITKETYKRVMKDKRVCIN